MRKVSTRSLQNGGDAPGAPTTRVARSPAITSGRPSQVDGTGWVDSAWVCPVDGCGTCNPGSSDRCSRKECHCAKHTYLCAEAERWWDLDEKTRYLLRAMDPFELVTVLRTFSVPSAIARGCSISKALTSHVTAVRRWDALTAGDADDGVGPLREGDWLCPEIFGGCGVFNCLIEECCRQCGKRRPKVSLQNVVSQSKTSAEPPVYSDGDDKPNFSPQAIRDENATCQRKEKPKRKKKKNVEEQPAEPVRRQEAVGFVWRALAPTVILQRAPAVSTTAQVENDAVLVVPAGTLLLQTGPLLECAHVGDEWNYSKDENMEGNVHGEVNGNLCQGLIKEPKEVANEMDVDIDGSSADMVKASDAECRSIFRYARVSAVGRRARVLRCAGRTAGLDCRHIYTALDDRFTLRRDVVVEAACDGSAGPTTLRSGETLLCEDVETSAVGRGGDGNSTTFTFGIVHNVYGWVLIDIYDFIMQRLTPLIQPIGPRINELRPLAGVVSDATGGGKWSFLEDALSPFLEQPCWLRRGLEGLTERLDIEGSWEAGTLVVTSFVNKAAKFCIRAIWPERRVVLELCGGELLRLERFVQGRVACWGRAGQLMQRHDQGEGEVWWASSVAAADEAVAAAASAAEASLKAAPVIAASNEVTVVHGPRAKVPPDGSAVEFFSVALQSWLPGVVLGRDDNMVRLDFSEPFSPAGTVITPAAPFTDGRVPVALVRGCLTLQAEELDDCFAGDQGGSVVGVALERLLLVLGSLHSQAVVAGQDVLADYFEVCSSETRKHGIPFLLPKGAWRRYTLAPTKETSGADRDGENFTHDCTVTKDCFWDVAIVAGLRQVHFQLPDAAFNALCAGPPREVRLQPWAFTQLRLPRNGTALNRVRLLCVRLQRPSTEH
eukprot:TRINITY_DN32051_c0_g1_i1.p1 TRINITY_DN32051_c0_g1~~TRINITY_DN32051_c0_g1_i1.p1  ORF type:complete len:891 (-),score=106.36 TRINITY_DN32051_c0_g1_i1:171-2843(-)